MGGDQSRCTLGGLDAMQDETGTQRDSASEVAGPLEWEVVAVRALPGFQLDVEFADGTRGRFDYSEFIHADDAGVFVALRDVSLFNRVFVDYGALTWPNGLDLAPDAMYERLKASTPNTVVKR
jgi:hypothetical protein